MLSLLSPAKRQNFTDPAHYKNYTKPQAIKDTTVLVDILRKYKPAQLERLMSVSSKIALLNHQRFQEFDLKKFNLQQAKQAIFAFQGDVYQALSVADFKEIDLKFMQEHLVILSGLYGYLRPLDLIQPYRLEMKTPLKNPAGKDLYQFWGDKITQQINKALKMHKNKTIINLASNEYFKVINPSLLKGQWIQISFKEKQGNSYKTVAIHAKRARGAMAAYIMKNHLDHEDKIKNFKENKYRYSARLSSENHWIFVR